MQRIARPVHHRQAQNRPGQIGIAEDLALDRDLVVLLVEPPEHLLEHLHALGRVGLKDRAQRRRFGEGHGLERSRFGAVKNAARAVHVATAQRDNAAARSAKDRHQCARLRAGAQNQIDDDVGRGRAKCGRMVGQLAAVSKNLARRRHLASMKDHDLVAEAIERARDVRTDEAAATDEKYAHGYGLEPDGGRAFEVSRTLG